MSIKPRSPMRSRMDGVAGSVPSGGNEVGLIVHLVLTYHWFDEMIAGRKDIEYRSMTPHWKRLIWDRRDRITDASFSRGYTSTTIRRPVQMIDVGPCPYNGWSASYYRLHLGPIMTTAPNNERRG